jgi:hypothetical protein
VCFFSDNYPASEDQISELVNHSLDRHVHYDTSLEEQHQQHQHQYHRSQSAPIVDHDSLLLGKNESLDMKREGNNTDSNKWQLHRSNSDPLPATISRKKMKRRGSKTGLTQESTQAVAWIHSIPWHLKPLIPGLFNLCNAALRWASLIYVAASIAEMLISGLELILSVLAARMIRKRQISLTRWAGVGVVAVGLLTVRAADVLDTDAALDAVSSSNNATAADLEEIEALKRDHTIGAMLIVGQCIASNFQDMAEELFLHEAEFPATLLLGMEGIYGLLFGVPIYLYLESAVLDEKLQDSNTTLVLEEDGSSSSSSSTLKTGYIVGMTMLFTVTGIFNIMATGVTSSMTRNMWKNFRTILVWVLGLVLFYSLGNNDLGEAWMVPDSFFILFGFLIMLSGIYVYYHNK